MKRLDYLVVGHVSRDITPQGEVIGGTAAYAGRVAAALGCQTAVFTSAPAGDDMIDAALRGLHVQRVEAAQATTFENIYTPQGRLQTLHARAQPLTRENVLANWPLPNIIHIGPVADEVAPEMIADFSGSIIGLTPQGWMRGWDENGRVSPKPWPAAAEILPLATAVVLSKEDLVDADMLANYRRWSRLLVLTDGARGCTLFCENEAHQLPAPDVIEVEPTGAGDIFAAAFFVRYWQTNGDIFTAARFANELAALSVTRMGLEAKIAAIRQHVQTEGQQ